MTELLSIAAALVVVPPLVLVFALGWLARGLTIRKPKKAPEA